ncbi:MAG TPA: hypothetical protein VF466_00960 [Candidatus Saccharimonadales bacterium]
MSFVSFVKTKQRGHILLGLAFVGLLVGCFMSIGSPRASADDTANYPWIRPDNWVAQIMANPTGGNGWGHMTVDIELDKPGAAYNPCHNTSDSFEAACDTPGGFYKVLRYHPGYSDFPYGVFIDNSNNGINHYWARRVKKVYMEIYPWSTIPGGPLSGYKLDPGACGCIVHGGFQVIVSDWKGGYSADIGKLQVTALEESDVGRLNGFIKRNGAHVGQDEVNIDWFGQDPNTTRSSTHYPVYSFASWPTNTDGYYTSGPVLKGNYHIYVTDKGPGGHGPTHQVECVGIPIHSTSDRMDLELTQQHFGLDAPGRQCYDH